jgi:DNA-binding XRE family transcriptional regulator
MTGGDRPTRSGEAIEFDSTIRRSKRETVRELVDRWCKAHTGRLQADLASTLGVHPVTLSRWRTGERAAPDWVLATLAEMLGVEVALDATSGWSVVGGPS